MTTTFNLIEILSELTNVIKVANNKIDNLQSSMEKLRLEFSEVKACSEFSTNKLKQVEAGMEGMDISAYTSAKIELAHNVKIVLYKSSKENQGESKIKTIDEESPALKISQQKPNIIVKHQEDPSPAI